MKLGIIGSGSIVELFIQSARLVEDINVTLMYSRSLEKAKSFAQKHNISNYCDSLDELVNSDLIDTIYIASPNSLHYPQALLALQHGKNVICEKPCCATVSQYQNLLDTAKENNVYILEAITNVYTENMQWIKDKLPQLGNISIINGSFCQYSSRFDQYQNKEITNIFDLNMEGGALVDIGIYLLHFVTYLFGMPKDIIAKANIGFNGVDTSGIIQLIYKDFIANLTYAKDCSCPHQVSICGYNNSIVIDKSSIGQLREVKLLDHKNNIIDTNELKYPHMYYEIKQINNIISNKDINLYITMNNHTLEVLSLLENIRKQINVKYPSDN